MKKELLLKVLGFLVFYLTLSPLSCYTSSNLELLAYLLFIFLIFYYQKKHHLFDNRSVSDRTRTALLFIPAFVIPAIYHFQSPFTTDIAQWLVILAVIGLHNEYKEKILSVFIKIYSIVLLIAILEYVIGYITGNAFIIHTSTSGEITFTQSIANLYRYGNLQSRFSALSNEPGALGAVCGFLLAFLPINKKNIFPITVFLIGGLLTLSLAFYLYLSFILIYKIFKKEIQFKYIALLMIILLCTIVLFKDNVQQAIVLRLAEAEQLDNRSSEQVNEFVAHIFETSDGIYGVGNRTAYQLQENSGEGNAGLKWKLFQYGIIGCGSYLLAMLLLYNKYRNRSVSYWFGIIFFLMYFYSVGMWGVPLFMLLLFTTPY